MFRISHVGTPTLGRSFSRILFVTSKFYMPVKKIQRISSIESSIQLAKQMFVNLSIRLRRIEAQQTILICFCTCSNEVIKSAQCYTFLINVLCFCFLLAGATIYLHKFLDICLHTLQRSAVSILLMAKLFSVFMDLIIHFLFKQFQPRVYTQGKIRVNGQI